MTSPRLSENQRVATVALSAPTMPPVPKPTVTPQKRLSCHRLWMCAVAVTPKQVRPRHSSMMRRGPNWSSNRPQMGAAMP